MKDKESDMTLKFVRTAETIFQKHIDMFKPIEVSRSVIEESGGFACFMNSSGVSKNMWEMLTEITRAHVIEISNVYGDLWVLYGHVLRMMHDLYEKVHSNKSDFVKSIIGWNPDLEDLSYQIFSRIEAEKDSSDILNELSVEISTKKYYDLCGQANEREKAIWSGSINENFIIPNDIVNKLIDVYPSIVELEKHCKRIRGYFLTQYSAYAIEITDEVEGIDDYEVCMSISNVTDLAFSGYLKNVEDADKFSEDLKVFMEGKKTKGYAALVEALLNLKLIDPIENRIKFYNSMKEFFGSSVGDQSGFYAYFNINDPKYGRLHKSNLISDIEKSVLDLAHSI